MSALEIARQAVDRYNAANGGKGGTAAVARLIGKSRSALSLYLAGKYPAKTTDAIEAAILRALAGRVACPHLGRDLAAHECRDFADRPMPMSNAGALRHWHACQNCPQNDGGDHAE